MRRPRSAPVARACAALLLAFVCCVGVQSALHAQDAPPNAYARASWDGQSVDLAKLHDTVVETVEKRFFDVARLKQLDWRARADTARPAVLSAPSLEEAVRRINSLLA